MSVGGFGNSGIVTDGLVFSVDAYNDKSYVDGETTSYNLISDGNNGTLFNSIDFDGKGWVFDGTNQYITFGNPDALNFGTSDFSVCVWFYRSENVITNLRLFSKGAIGSDPSDAGFTMFGSDVSIAFGVNPSGTRISTGWAYNTLNTPVMYTGICNRATGKMSSYGNGEFIQEAAGTLGAGTTTASHDFVVGKYNTNQFYWDGGVYLIMFYNRVLTTPEVKQNYNALKYRFT